MGCLSNWCYIQPVLSIEPASDKSSRVICLSHGPSWCSIAPNAFSSTEPELSFPVYHFCRRDAVVRLWWGRFVSSVTIPMRKQRSIRWRASSNVFWGRCWLWPGHHCAVKRLKIEGTTWREITSYSLDHAGLQLTVSLINAWWTSYWHFISYILFCFSFWIGIQVALHWVLLLS